MLAALMVKVKNRDKIQDTIFVNNTIHSIERYIISQHDKSGNIDFCSV